MNLDWRAVRAGGTVALVFAVPFAVAARWIADDDPDSSAPLWLSLLALVGFFLGAGVAGWVQRRDLPMVHGIVTAALTYAVAQAVLITIRLVLGREVHWFATFFTLTAVAFVGLIGGILAGMMHRRGIYPKGANG